MKKLFALPVLILCTASFLQAQYQPTMWEKVTYYDFHSNGSNPEFEKDPGGGAGVHLGMVRNTLDGISGVGKPVVGPVPYWNCSIAKWFKPWTPGDFTIPNYQTPLTTTCANGTTTVNYDTAFKNIVFRDSLQFTHLGNGVYQYSNQTFFPLDGRGFGNEGKAHNYAFTMELHDTFTYREDLIFQFEGDDDVWCFINGNLAMDLGGIHNAAPGQFNLNDIPGLVPGRKYSFDFFYAERHQVGSDIKITTNLIAPTLRELKLSTNPPIDTIPTGATLTGIATVIDDTNGVRPEFLPRVTWTLIDTVGNPPLAYPSTGRVTFTPTKAFCDVYIIGTLIDSVNGVILKDTIKVYVKAGPADHVVIEADANGRTRSPRKDDPVGGNGTITIGSTELSRNVYATLRDKYGNYVGQSTNTLWDTLRIVTANVVSARQGNAAIGEGVVTKLGVADSMHVRATARDVAGNLSDTIKAIVSDITYDSLRIVVMRQAVPVRIWSLAMTTDDDTVLTVQGLRTALNDWVEVPGAWSLSSNLRSRIAPPAGQTTWNFSPVDTGKGTIAVNFAGKSTSVPVTIGPGKPNYIVLYPKEGAVPSAGNRPYPRDTTITAGVVFPLVAKIFDTHSVWLGEYETVDSLQPLMTWTLSDPARATLTPLVGHKAAFRSTQAYFTYNVIATYRKGAVSRSDTISIAIVPAPAAQLVLEENKDKNYSPNKAVPVDSITILAYQTYKTVYAILRDQYGNWVDFSKQTSWGDFPDGIVTVTDGIQFQGEGIVTRMVDSGVAQVSALNVEPAYAAFRLADTIKVKLVKIFYRALRIVVRDSTDIDTVSMNTNQDTTLKVLGKRSDNNKWENVTARWKMETGLVTAPMPPDQANRWTFSPVSPGQGWVRVSMDNDSTLPDSAYADFTRGPPTKVEIILVTPPGKLIAGDTIRAEVRIYNKDGLIPGAWCENGVIHKDTIGSGGHQNPVVIGDSGAVPLNQASSSSQKVTQCFKGGIDTVKYVLYYAPLNPDSLHQLQIAVDDSLTSKTVFFRLKPGAIDSVEIQDIYNHHRYRDTTLNFPTGSVSLHAIGYDAYGNLIDQSIPEGDTLDHVVWSTTGSLHQPSGPAGANVYYSAQNVRYDEQGNLYATLGGLKDFVPIKIFATPATFDSAVTRDVNGNGLLDRIDVYFNKKVPVGKDATGKFIIKFNNKNFVADSIIPINDSSYMVYIKETQFTPGDPQPQTSWTPSVEVKSVPGVQDKILTARDGAPPVIWKVFKHIIDAERKHDTVRVVMSEPIQGSSGGLFNINQAPDSVFHVWVHKTINGRDTLVRDTSMLRGITSFTKVFPGKTGCDTIAFVMTNGEDLTTNHFFNIYSTTRTFSDRAGNYPAANNHKVQVLPFGQFIFMDIFPNPSPVTFKHHDYGPGELKFKDEPDAIRWVQREHAGVVISINGVMIPSDGSKVRGIIKIYDAVGNSVNWHEEPDVISKLSEGKKAASVAQVNLYWNGSNKQGMAVAPGVYRVAVFIEYAASAHLQNGKLLKKVGISR